MPKRGRLEVELIANLARFSSGMSSANRQLKGIADAVASARRMVLGFGAAVLGAAGVGGLGLFARASAQAADQIGKLATRTGLTVETLQAVKLAAGLAGSSLETVATGLRGMSMALAEGARDGGEMSAVLQGLGLDASALVASGPEEAFASIRRAIKGLPDEITRMYVAQRLLGRSGTELIPLLLSEGDSIEEVYAQLTNAGLMLDTIDIRGIEAMNDSVERAQATMTALAQQILAELAPAVTAGMAAIESALQGLASSELPGQIAELFVGTFGAIGNVLRDAAWAMAAFQAKYATARYSLAAPGSAAERFWESEVVKAVTSMESIENAKSPAERVREWWDAIADEVAKRRIAGLGAGDEFGSAIGLPTIDTFRAIADAQKTIGRGLDDMTSAAERWLKAIQTPAEKFQADLAELERLVVSGALSLDEYGRAADKALEAAVKGITSGGGAITSPAAVYGSSDAYSIEARARMAPSDTVEKAQLAELRRIAGLLAGERRAAEAARMAELVPMDAIAW